MVGFALAVAWSLWLGILTSIHPCPLAANIVAVSYIARRLDRPRQVFLAGLAYTIGRAGTYVAIGTALVGGLLSSPAASSFLQREMNRVAGPVLMLLGMFLLGLLRFGFRPMGISPPLPQRADRFGIWGAGLLGVVFALSFCPISATYFFLNLIPLAIQFRGSTALPAAYGIGTALPVIGFAALLSAGVGSVGRTFEQVRRFEWWARQITGILFLLVGCYYSLKCIFEVIR
jgi:cytochrome c biogenesis protein CcdA